MPDDKRMLFIKNMESPDLGSPESLTWEYQVLADAKFVGRMTYGPYELMLWDVRDEAEGEERSLCLRLKQSFSHTQAGKEASKSGFYHGGGVEGELVALASLFLRRRLRLGSVMRVNDEPMRLPSKGEWIDMQVVQGHSQLKELEGWLRRVEALDPKYHQRFILATRLYQQALELIEAKPDLAYLNLVSSIEVFARNYPVSEPTVAELDPSLGGLIDRIADHTLRQEIEQGVLARERLIGRRFKEFLVQHTEESFWQAPGRPERGRIDPSELPALLDRIYKQRSRTLHEGEPFPPNVFHPFGEEIPRCLGMSHGERAWQPSEFIPSPAFFERLVNHVLKNFVTRNQVKSGSS